MDTCSESRAEPRKSNKPGKEPPPPAPVREMGRMSTGPIPELCDSLPAQRCKGLRRSFLVAFLLFYSWMTAAVTADLSRSLLVHFRPDGGASLAASPAGLAGPHFREAQKQVFEGTPESLSFIARIDVTAFATEGIEHETPTASSANWNSGRAPPAHLT